VEILDATAPATLAADTGSNKIHIEIERTATVQAQTELISVNHTVFDLGQGAIFVLQIVSTAILIISICKYFLFC